MAVRALFFGTPAFAVPCLDALAEALAAVDGRVVAAVCQPDKPAGRGLQLAAPPVKTRALEMGVPVVQPTKLRTGEFSAWVRSQDVDFALVVAYGRILPADVLAAPRLGAVNVHASLLPKYRGAAPITWCLVRGEKETGVTLMQMDAGMDTGPMLEQFRLPIGDSETAGELALRLARVGADAVRAGVPKVLGGAYVPVPQDDAAATDAPILKKEHGLVPWGKPAGEVHDHVRGMNPWPGAWTTHRKKNLKLLGARVAPEGHVSAALDAPATPGRVVFADKHHVVVACGEGSLELLVVQPEGKRAMRAGEWLLGRGIAEGDVLGGAT
jgi:methionyl-tRNA formyltransferase